MNVFVHGWVAGDSLRNYYFVSSVSGPLNSTLYFKQNIGCSLSFFYSQKQIIEDLFGLDWLQRSIKKGSTHPAVLKWAFSSQIVKNNGAIKNANDPATLKIISSVLLDNFNIVSCSRDTNKYLTLGKFYNYGNDKVRKKVKSVIYSPNGFNSLLTEFSFGAWNIDKGYDITPFEEEGWPDFRILFPNIDIPVYVDCKKINKDSSDNRFGTIIKKANKQIKKPNETCYGLVVIDITEKIKEIRHYGHDSVADISPISLLVSKCLKNYNTSVNEVLLYWDECLIFDNDNKSISTALRRKSLLLKHDKPKVELVKKLPYSKFGYTVEFTIENSNQKEPAFFKKSKDTLRNAKCPCNGGLRFKKCCGKL